MFTSDGGKRVRSAKELAAHIMQAQSRPGPKKTVVASGTKGDPRKQEMVKKKTKKKMTRRKK